MSKEQAARRKRAPASESAAPKFQAPKGFTRQSSDAEGFWTDDGESSVLFIPRGVKLFDGNKRLDSKKPSCMIIGELRSTAPLASKDEEFDGNVGDVVGVFWKPGMGREVAFAYGVETWIAPLYDEEGERKTRDVGRAEPMKLYDVQFGRKLEGKRLPVLEDRRKDSRDAWTPFTEQAETRVVARAVAPAGDGTTLPETDDDDIPF